MKKKYFLSAIALCGLMTLASCGSDDDPIPEKGGEEPEAAAGEQVIVLDMQDTDVLSTKSRPLYSTTNQGSEKVTDVKLLVFQATAEGNKLKKVISVPNWNSTSSDYNYGRKRTIKLTGDDKLKTSDFDGSLDVNITILAVGQDETKDLIPAPFKVNSKTIPELAIATGNLETNAIWNAGAKAGEGFLKTDAVTYPTYSGLSTSTSASVVGEIFSGQSQPVQVNINEGLSITVLLKRQVAGVLGYFNRIPAYVKTNNSDKEGEYNSVGAIRLVSSMRNTQVDLTTQLDQQTDDTTNGPKQERVMSGFATTPSTADANFGTGETSRTADAYTIYQIDLTKWFKKGTDASNSGFWGGSDALITEEDGTALEIPLLGASKGWVNGIKSTNDFPTVATGSVLAGEFMIPIAGDLTKSQTLELQLLDSVGSKVLKTWAVKLDAVSQDPTTGDGDKVYNIYRNHLYQLGLRGKGDSPENPGTDPDKPQPLDKDQELVIKINDQWEFIHDMEIE
ncbi:hypothetical protein [Parabacteroides sp.]